MTRRSMLYRTARKKKKVETLLVVDLFEVVLSQLEIRFNRVV